MSLGKKYLIKNISSKAYLSNIESSNLLLSFLELVKSTSKEKIKISNFGTFSTKETLERFGRNPQNMKIYKIPKRRKLSFQASNTVKKFLN